MKATACTVVQKLGANSAESYNIQHNEQPKVDKLQHPAMRKGDWTVLAERTIM